MLRKYKCTVCGGKGELLEQIKAHNDLDWIPEAPMWLTIKCTNCGRSSKLYKCVIGECLGILEFIDRNGPIGIGSYNQCSRCKKIYYLDNDFSKGPKYHFHSSDRLLY